MAELDVGMLSDRLGEDELEMALKKLRKHLGEPDIQLPRGDVTAAGTHTEGLDDNAVIELMDRLDAEELGCDFFVPLDFEGKVDVGVVQKAIKELDIDTSRPNPWLL